MRAGSAFIGTPADIVEMVRAYNDMVGGIDSGFRSSRRFLSHFRRPDFPQRPRTMIIGCKDEAPRDEFSPSHSCSSR
jgi:hypothetical protein